MNDTQSMSQFVRRIQIGLLAIILVGVGGIGGYSLGQYDAKKATGHDDVAFNSFWQAWDIIDSNYFGDKDATKRVDGAIAGMVESLGDPHTLYLEAKQDKLFRSDLEGSFSGIGAELLVKSGVLMIDAVLDDSPAQRSGLKANDALIEIDGVKTSGLSFVDAIDHIRGEKGTTVTLTVGREGADEALKVPVVRDTITVKSVKTDTLGENKDIAYIKISQFGEESTKVLSI